MKKEKFLKNIEKAQILPIVVFGLIVLVAFSALIIDGGSIMLNRREAQAAADAGAMAGARELCYSTGADPLVVADNYASMNGAATVNAQIIDGLVNVTTTINNESFFAKMFNQDTLEAEAEAAAGCFAPYGNYLMPIAWACRPSYADEEPFDPGLSCESMQLDWDELLRPLVDRQVSTIEIPGNSGEFKMDDDPEYSNSIVSTSDDSVVPRQLYIVMDKMDIAEEAFCKEDLDPADPAYDLALTCDLDGDGKIDIHGGGSRAWLDLDGGGGGADSTKDWIEHGVDFPISPHTWIPTETGNMAVAYAYMKDYREGDVVLIPVFNAICYADDPRLVQPCMDAAHLNPPFEDEPPGGDNNTPGAEPKYHVITFTPFYISCVHEKKKDKCPGFYKAYYLNFDDAGKPMIDEGTPAVEGYFLNNVDLVINVDDPCNVNLGNCLVSLIK